MARRGFRMGCGGTLAAGAMVIAHALASPAATAQPVRLGGEFQVNTRTQGDQHEPAVASDRTGNFVIVWTGPGRESLPEDLFAQRYDCTGAKTGPEVQLNSVPVGLARPAVAIDGRGGFVVVWQSITTGDDPSGGIAGRRFDRTGRPRGGEFQVNAYTPGYQADPAVAAAGGGFLVVWESLRQDGDGWGIFGRLFARAGLPRGGDFQINSSTVHSQFGPAVAADAHGGFVVVWTSSTGVYGNSAVAGQRLGADGARIGEEFVVASERSYAHDARVAAGADGDFVVVWQESDAVGPGSDIFARRFDGAGIPRGAEFQVNAYTTGFQWRPAVAMGPDGSVVVVWESTGDGAGQDGDRSGIFGRLYDAAGRSVGGEFLVNSYTTWSQGYPAAAADGGGRFIVTWTSETRDPEVRFRIDRRVVAQHYALAAVCGDDGLACPRSCAAARAGPPRQRWTGSLRPESARPFTRLTLRLTVARAGDEPLLLARGSGRIRCRGGRSRCRGRTGTLHASYRLVDEGQLSFSATADPGETEACQLLGSLAPASTSPWAPPRGAVLSGTYTCTFADGEMEHGFFSATQRRRGR